MTRSPDALVRYEWLRTRPITGQNVENTGRGEEQKMLRKKIVTEIPEGRHTGRILRVEHRTEPYAYTDVIVSIDDLPGVEVKTGEPTNLSVDVDGSPRSGLAKLLSSCGLDLSGDTVNEQDIVGQKVSYMTQNEETDKGTFARIVKKSLKRIE